MRDVHHVSGTVHGCQWRGPITKGPEGYFLSLGAAWLRDSPSPLEGEIEVSLAPEGPQAEGLAVDFREALDAEPDAKAFFEGLATFYRKGYVNWIGDAKRPITRSTRIAETVAALKAGKKQR